LCCLITCAEIIFQHLDAAFARIWTLNREDNALELQASAGMYRTGRNATRHMRWQDVQLRQFRNWAVRSVN